LQRPFKVKTKEGSPMSWPFFNVFLFDNFFEAPLELETLNLLQSKFKNY